MGLMIQLQEPVGEAAQVFGGDPVLKAGQGELGGQVSGSLREPLSHDFEGGIVGQGAGVLAYP